MQNGIALRSLRAQDGPALAGLSYSVTDGGFIQYSANYQIDAFRAVEAIHGSVMGVAACSHDSSRMVGMGIIRFGHCQVEGETYPYALLGNLIVHPDYRRQGLAARLAQWQVEKAREQIGENSVMVTNFQIGNRVSHHVYNRWLKRHAGTLYFIPLRTDPEAPAGLPGVTTGPLDENEYAAFAENHNAFYAGSNFFEPLSAESLSTLCLRSPFRTPFRHAYTAVDPSGRLLAGLVVMEEYRLKQMEIRGLPKSLALLNKLFSIIPKDGFVREVYLDHLWYAPGQVRAARQLVESVRWIWANRATNISALIDPKGPLAPVFSTHPWTVKAKSHMLFDAPNNITPGRPICPLF